MTTTSPEQEVRVRCPKCDIHFTDWWRPAINLDLDDFEEEYLERATTADCPRCHARIQLDAVVVKDGALTRP